MKKILTISLFIFSLHANTYPQLFDQLGTPLYKADKVFQSLPDIPNADIKIQTYHLHAQELLDFGKQIDSKNKKDVKEYINRLRTLQKEHDRVIDTIGAALIASIDKNDYDTFKTIISTNIINKNRVIVKRSMAYYVQNRGKGKIEALEGFYQTLESDPVLYEYVKGHLPKSTAIKHLYKMNGDVQKAIPYYNNHHLASINGAHCFKISSIKEFETASESASYTFVNNSCNTQDLVISKNEGYAYVADGEHGFVILDISDSHYPTEKGEYNKLHAQKVLINEDEKTAFILKKRGGITIVDISSKEDPKLLSQFNKGIAISAFSLDEKGQRLYFIHKQGIGILDISNHGNPRLLEESIKGEFDNILVLDDTLMITSKTAGIQFFNISQNMPQYLTSYVTISTPYALTTTPDPTTLLVSQGDAGVQLLDISNLHNIQHIMQYTFDEGIQAYSSSVDEKGKNIYVSCGKDGVAKIGL